MIRFGEVGGGPSREAQSSSHNPEDATEVLRVEPLDPADDRNFTARDDQVARHLIDATAKEAAVVIALDDE